MRLKHVLEKAQYTYLVLLFYYQGGFFNPPDHQSASLILYQPHRLCLSHSDSTRRMLSINHTYINIEHATLNISGRHVAQYPLLFHHVEP